MTCAHTQVQNTAKNALIYGRRDLRSRQANIIDVCWKVLAGQKNSMFPPLHLPPPPSPPPSPPPTPPPPPDTCQLSFMYGETGDRKGGGGQDVLKSLNHKPKVRRQIDSHNRKWNLQAILQAGIVLFGDGGGRVIWFVKISRIFLHGSPHLICI